MKKHDEFAELQLRASFCPGLETEWAKPDTTHWIALHTSAKALRKAMSQALASLDAISLNKDLSPEGKRRKAQEMASKMLDQLEEAISFDKARESVARQMAKWNEAVNDHVKPAATEAEAALHGEIRRHVASLKDERARMSFLEKNGADPRVASALLEAPAFLSGVGNAELALVQQKVEQECLSPEVVKAKTLVTKALAELERGFRAAHSILGLRAGAQLQAPEQPPKAPVKAKPNEPNNAPAPVWSPKPQPGTGLKHVGGRSGPNGSSISPFALEAGKFKGELIYSIRPI